MRRRHGCPRRGLCVAEADRDQTPDGVRISMCLTPRNKCAMPKALSDGKFFYHLITVENSSTHPLILEINATCPNREIAYVNAVGPWIMVIRPSLHPEKIPSMRRLKRKLGNCAVLIECRISWSFEGTTSAGILPPVRFYINTEC
jgi:hypothetical protein